MINIFSDQTTLVYSTFGAHIGLVDESEWIMCFTKLKDIKEKSKNKQMKQLQNSPEFEIKYIQ